jgi:hypothetical protein
MFTYFGVCGNMDFVSGKKKSILHQKTSSLQEAIFNNAYGIAPGSLGSDLLKQSTQNLSNTYRTSYKFKRKVLKVEGEFPEFTIVTNKNSYKSKIIVVLLGSKYVFH